MKHVTEGRILKHNNHQYGFKLSFLSLEDAQQAKDEIGEFLESRHYIVTCYGKKRYYGTAWS